MAKQTITEVHFRNYKALRDFRVPLRHINVLVGPNNAGKSTIIGAFRVLSVALRRARHRKPDAAVGADGTYQYVHKLGGEDLPIAIENVHTNYADSNTTVTFKLNSGERMVLEFPPNEQARFYVKDGTPTSPTQFKKAFDLEVGVVPPLGPVEHFEEVVKPTTVTQNLGTHRAPRHFRNYWWHFPEAFQEFQNVLASTWPDISVRAPEHNVESDELTMFCTEDRFPRELYWIGSGFQIWCQLISHIVRSSQSSLIIVDEPEIYLHPDMQRQLLKMLRAAGPDVLLATHSSEVVAEAESGEILVVNKKWKDARIVRRLEGLQGALEQLGSAHNLALTQLARTRKVLFVEGQDFQLIRQLAGVAGLDELSSALGFAIFPIGGFANWSNIIPMKNAIQATLSLPIEAAVVLDRDFYCDDEILDVTKALENDLRFVYILPVKEVENFLLNPAVLDRAVRKSIREREKRTGVVCSTEVNCEQLLQEVTGNQKSHVGSQLVTKVTDYYRKKAGSRQDPSTVTMARLQRLENEWQNLATRSALVNGKQTFADLCTKVKAIVGCSISRNSVASEYRKSELPVELMTILTGLEAFRSSSLLIPD